MAKPKKAPVKQEVVTPPPSLRRLIAQHRQLALGIAVGVALIGLGWLVYVVVDDPPANVAEVVVCNDELLTEAAGVLEASKYMELRTVVDKIQALPSYEEDPNCLNVVVTYYINTSDYTQAKSYMDKLEAAYRASRGFSPLLGDQAKTIETLRADVEFLEKLEEQFRQNIRPGPEVEP